MVCKWIFLSHAVILELTLCLYEKLFFLRTEKETRNVRMKALTRCFYKKKVSWDRHLKQGWRQALPLIVPCFMKSEGIKDLTHRGDRLFFLVYRRVLRSDLCTWRMFHKLNWIWKDVTLSDVHGGTQKFSELLKKYLKYLYKFENLVLFEVLPLRLDSAIPALLPMLETLTKIFNGNDLKGRQRFAGGPWEHYFEED